MRASPTPLLLPAFLTVFLTVSLPFVSAQEAVLRIRPPERIRVSERSNLSTRENGRYAGLLSRQITGYLAANEDGTAYNGRFFLFTQVRRDLQDVARPVERSIEASTRITAHSLFDMSSVYPSYQELLAIPDPPPPAGTSWESLAWIIINPTNDASPLRLPVPIAYRYVGIESWNGEPAHRVDARFATRYPLPPSDDEDAPIVVHNGPLVRVQGGHEMTIMLPVGSGQVAFIRDEYREQYQFSDGRMLEHQGHVLLFLSGLSADETRRTASQVEQTIVEKRIEGVTVEPTDVGVRVTVRELRFLPDQAVLLPDERPRIHGLAEALSGLESRRLLIVGHTADVGSDESQRLLSVERARTIARELSARGVDPNLIDIEGRGGLEPVATNSTEEGRAQNRRVEIFLVEQ